MTRVWPDDYVNWNGNFDELLETANQVLFELDPSAKPLTARTLRHYQQTQVVGRGSKQGRSATFSFKDLSDVVAAKNLVNEGWTLNHTSALLNSGEYEHPSSLVGSSSASDLSKNAISVVSNLLSASGGVSASLSGGLSHQARSFAAPMGASFAATSINQISTQPVPEAVHVYALSPGVSLHCSPQWLATASPQDKNNAFSQLERLAQQLKSKS